jgi:hypothetical protein
MFAQKGELWRMPPWLIILLAKLRIKFAVRRIKMWRSSPYDDRLDEYDAFLSYKSEDVDIVRKVADRLIASGLKVWFAEYVVLLQERDKFEAAIAYGTANSKCGVIFTSDLFRTNATYTGDEVRRLLESRTKRGTTCLRVKLHPDAAPSGQGMPALDSILEEDTFTNQGQHFVDIESVVEFILARFPGAAKACPPLPGELKSPDYNFVVQTSQWRYRINTTNWKIIQPAKGFLPDGDFDGPRFRRRLHGCPTVLHVQFGLDGSPTRPLPVSVGALDDRKVFEDILDFAKRYVGGRRYECVGVHLFSIHQYSKYSHAVLTYWNKFSWIRRYSIILPHPLKMNVNCELVFHFDFYGSFLALCNATASMDSVVRTLEWGKRTSMG